MEKLKKKRISKRHDEYFKANKKLWNPSVFENLLGKEIVDQIDFSTLELESAEFIDESLSKSAADLVLVADFKNKKDSVGIIILLEHKSYEDHLALLQILRYAILEWIDELQTTKGTKPVRFVIPILVYHLSQGKSWPYPFKTQELFDQQGHPFFDRFIPKFEVIPLNLACDIIPPKLTPLLLLVEASMFESEEELYLWYKRLKKNDPDLLSSEYLTKSSIYIQLNNKNNLNYKKVIKLISEDKEMTTYIQDIDDSCYKAAEEKGIEIGIEKGIEKGIEQGVELNKKNEQIFKMKMAKELLLRGMEPDQISQISNLSLEDIKALGAVTN